MPDPFCNAVSLDFVMPAFISKELYGYCKDVGHATRLELDLIRPETQLMIAKTLRDSLDPNATDAQKGFGPSIPLPIGKLGLPGNLSLKIWSKDINDLAKGDIKGAMFNYELYRF